MNAKSCDTCGLLDSCKDTDETKLMRGYSCHLFQLADEVTLLAREAVIEDFGLRALKFEIPAVKRKRVQRARRTHRHV